MKTFEKPKSSLKKPKSAFNLRTGACFQVESSDDGVGPPCSSSPRRGTWSWSPPRRTRRQRPGRGRGLWISRCPTRSPLSSTPPSRCSGGASSGPKQGVQNESIVMSFSKSKFETGCFQEAGVRSSLHRSTMKEAPPSSAAPTFA